METYLIVAALVYALLTLFSATLLYRRWPTDVFTTARPSLTWIVIAWPLISLMGFLIIVVDILTENKGRGR